MVYDRRTLVGCAVPPLAKGMEPREQGEKLALGSGLDGRPERQSLKRRRKILVTSDGGRPWRSYKIANTLELGR